MASIFDLQFQHDDVDSKIAAALERLSQTFRVLLWEKTKSHNLSPIQIQMLVYLFYHSHEEITMGQLAARFSLTPATVSDAVKTLVQKGLVVRTPTARDRRAVSVKLNAAGRKMANKLTAWADVIRDNLSRFEDRDK
ncbi:MAG: MarR family transcriptional regulator, partial [Calditrichaeota bacterium]